MGKRDNQWLGFRSKSRSITAIYTWHEMKQLKCKKRKKMWLTTLLAMAALISMSVNWAFLHWFPSQIETITSKKMTRFTLQTLTSACTFSILFYTFPKLLTRRICLTIRSIFSWWSVLNSCDLKVCDSGVIL